MLLDTHKSAYLKKAGIKCQKVIEVMSRTDRSLFVSERYKKLAKTPRVIPLDCGQYIPHDINIAQIVEASLLSDGITLSVLVVGAGSMYSSVVIRGMGSWVTAIERQPKLLHAGRHRLRRLDVSGVNLHLGNGLDGWKTAGPYDRIILFGSAENLRSNLYAQLKPNGYLILPADVDGEPAILRGQKSRPTEILPLFEGFTPLEDSMVVFNQAV